MEEDHIRASGRSAGALLRGQKDDDQRGNNTTHCQSPQTDQRCPQIDIILCFGTEERIVEAFRIGFVVVQIEFVIDLVFDLVFERLVVRLVLQHFLVLM